MKHLITTSLFLLLTLSLHAQMWNGQDTLYGNEWIRYDQSYYKFKVADDGVYRIPFEQLQAAGIPTGSVRGQQFQLFHLGEEIPVHVSTDELMAAGDYLEFYGEKNRSELDRYLYTDPDADLLNPEYSLITDSAAYFLTWVPVGTPTLRYTTIENDLTNLPAPEAWYWAEEKIVFSDQLLKRYTKFNGVDIYYSHFDGDGFGHAYTEETAFTLSAPNRYAGGPDASLQINLMGNSNSEGHALQIDMNSQLIESDTFFGTKIRKYQYAFAPASLSDEIELTVRGLNATDRYGVSLGKIRYPATFQFDAPNLASLELPPANGERYLALNGLRNESYIVLEPEQRLMARVNGSALHELKLPARSGSRQLIWQAASTVNTVSPLKPVQFTDFQEANTNYLIISSDRLFDDGNGNNWVQAYADYRSSPDGGNYQTAIIEIQQLFDQFAYGIDFHPLSVRNGFYYLNGKKWKDLAFLFLIGKGQEYRSIRKNDALQTAIASGDMLIPSFGYPASDNLLLTLNEKRVSPIPIGRLAATNSREVQIYLEKVKEIEASGKLPQSISERAWTKQILHLGGGSSASEQNNIRSGLEIMAQEIEQNAFGGSVKSFYKNSTDVIQNSISQEIFEYINSGTAIITFFGHSSPGTFDFNIDNPENYENKGRYPLMLSLGCYSGNLFGTSKSISERFTFFEDKGTVVFGASRGLGFISSLSTFANSFYKNIGEIHYGKSIGEALRATYLDHQSNEWIGMSTLVEQFTIHGDPAIRLHPVDGPDYVIDPASVSFTPEVVTSQLDSLEFNFEVVNLGLHRPDSMSIIVQQELPGGSKIEHPIIRVESPAYSERYQVKLPVLGKEAVGLNTFFLTVDAENEISESPQPAAENNNELIKENGTPGISLFIIDNTARPIFPPKFAIIGESPILRASTSNTMAPNRSYIIELDTSMSFQSPVKQSQKINQRGGIIEWAPNFSFQDGKVYYWRISQDSVNAEVAYNWENSSFSFLKNSPNGWRQAHYWQWLEGEMETLKINDKRQFQFIENVRDFRIRNTVRSVDNNLRPNGLVNGNIWSDFFRFNIAQSLTVVVVDTVGQFWLNFKPGEFGSVNSNAVRIASYPFPTSTLEERAKVITFLEDIIPDDHYVFVYPALRDTIHDLNIAEWESDSLQLDGKNIFNVLEKQGALFVRNLKNEMRPYVFAYRKNKLTLGEKIAATKRDVADFETVLPGLWTEGIYRTPLIGPASDWEELSWSTSPLIESDTIFLSLYGQSTDGSEVLLFDNWTGRDTSLSFVDPTVFPYLKAEVYIKDDRDFTSVQLQSLRILYEGLPDAALNPQKHFSFSSDTLFQGQPLNIQIAVENPSLYDLDSLLINYKIVNAFNEETTIQNRLSALSSGDTLIASLKLATDEMSGPHTFSIEVNPGPEQAEMYFFNNYGERSFYVAQDRKSPILDVTFDGQHILEGDLVSARPEIEISLSDENEYLLLKDTSLIELSIRFPDQSIQKVGFNDNRVTFIPASEKNNEATLLFHPTFKESGQYTLIVQGRDASGNTAGQLDYSVNFEIIVERMISNVLAYPNPFTTSTQFVYTLTGDESPQHFQIQIMTVSGKIVREIDQTEFGPLLIGTHRSDFTWDGTDEFGDRLANGVYLYRIKAKDSEGNDYKAYENGTAQYFDRGFGKLVILR